MIRIHIDDRQIQQALRCLRDAADDLAPALQDIGEYLASATRQRFAEGKDPKGAPWAPLSARTIAGKGHAKPLIGETGLLRKIRYQLEGPDTVAVGTGAEYGATHQFGAKKGRFGKTRKGRPIPWGDIPARPFLGVSDEDRTAILDILQEHLEGAIGRG